MRAILVALGVGACVVSLGQPAQPAARESVRAELDRLQKQTGLSLATTEGGKLSPVIFSTRTFAPDVQLTKDMRSEGPISPDGSRLAFKVSRKTGQMYKPPNGPEFPLYTDYLGIMRIGGDDLHEYPSLEGPVELCWSYDNALLALRAEKREAEKITSALKLLDVAAENTQDVEVLGDTTTQCWSPDRMQFVYTAEDNIKIYDVGQKTSRVLTRGSWATWAPNGEWIAFQDGNRYYAIRPSGGEKKVLFKEKGALTPLWWSPDSRFVAYESYLRFPEGMFESWWPPIEQGRLRVRRLEDNAEDWVVNLYVQAHVPQFQWIHVKAPAGSQ